MKPFSEIFQGLEEYGLKFQSHQVVGCMKVDFELADNLKLIVHRDPDSAQPNYHNLLEINHKFPTGNYLQQVVLPHNANMLLSAVQVFERDGIGCRVSISDITNLSVLDFITEVSQHSGCKISSMSHMTMCHHVRLLQQGQNLEVHHDWEHNRVTCRIMLKDIIESQPARQSFDLFIPQGAQLNLEYVDMKQNPFKYQILHDSGEEDIELAHYESASKNKIFRV